MMREVRTRFAPSPTGMLHIGGVRTALYNYLFAKKHGGQFVLRIEDTDSTRFVPEAEQYIISTLQWLDIMPDEGIINGGPYGPYRQSNRKEIYQEYAHRLIELGHAYYAFDSPDELEAMHHRLSESRVPNPQYGVVSREWMKNSLTLPADEVKSRIANREPYVIRFKIPCCETVRFYDEVRGWLKVDTSTLDDKILLKSDGMATYHLASIVDDYLMKISHVIRGEEWLPSAPFHMLGYKAFGWGDTMPVFVHLPLLLKPEGQGKLSKRDAEEHGFPIFPLSWYDKQNNKNVIGFKEKGYLPEAIINFLALMGWNPGDNREIFSKDELINEFSIERLGKSGARFNIKKAEWFNRKYLGNKNIDYLTTYITEDFDRSGIKYSTNTVHEVCELIKDRATFTNDLPDLAKPFFIDPQSYDDSRIDNTKVNDALVWIRNFIISTENMDWTYSSLHDVLNEDLKQKGLKMVDVMPTFRLILFGSTNGPDIIKSMIILGKEKVKCRISKYEVSMGTILR